MMFFALELERERERGVLGLRCRADLGFQSRGVYIRKGMGCRLEDGGYAPRGSREVSCDVPGRRRGGDAEGTVWVGLSFSS